MQEALLERFWARDERVLEHVMAQYGTLCKNLGMQILGNSQDTEECLNEALLRVWNSIPPNRPNSLRNYLCKIMRQCSLDRYRYRHRQKRSMTEVELAAAECSEIIQQDDAIETWVDSEAIRTVLHSFLETLEEKERVIFVRRYWFFDSISDLARRLHMNENTVRTVLHRSRQKLREQLERSDVAL